MASMRSPFFSAQQRTHSADTDTPAKQCFICYDRNNPQLNPDIRNLVRKLAADLTAHGLTIAGDVIKAASDSQWGAPGAEWGENMLQHTAKSHQDHLKAIASSQFVIVLVSNNLNHEGAECFSFNSEFAIANQLQDERRLKVFPILCEGTLEKNLPLTAQGKLSLAFTDICKIDQVENRALISGNYADLFQRYILKAVGVTPSHQPAVTLKY